MSRILSVSVYQPVVPLRVVEVWIGDNDKVVSCDMPVLGVQVELREFEGVADTDMEAWHSVLVWTGESISTVNEYQDEYQEVRVIIGPAANGDDWWSSEIERKASGIRRFEKKKGKPKPQK